MRYALISDIHSNLEARERVFADIAGQEVERILCLGDIVGYGADPNACARMVRDRCEVVVMGNHDFAAIGRENLAYFNPYAREAATWTQGKLDPDVVQFLESLPFTATEGDALLVHATPSAPAAWDYLFSATFAQFEFASFSQRICFIGHSHQPVIFESAPGRRVRSIPPGLVDLEDGCRYIVNVGSVGQPRDGDPRASYGIYDSEADLLEIRRVPYDITTAQGKILSAGLPSVLANRLVFGE